MGDSGQKMVGSPKKKAIKGGHYFSIISLNRLLFRHLFSEPRELTCNNRGFNMKQPHRAFFWR